MGSTHGYSVASIWEGEFDEEGIRDWAKGLRERLAAPEVSLGLVFMTPEFFDKAETVLELLRVHARVPVLLGCSSTSLIAAGREMENRPGLALGLYHLPNTSLHVCHLTETQLEECNGPAYWHVETGIGPGESNGWLAFVDPFHFNSLGWLEQWNEAYAPTPIFGGLASGELSANRVQLYWNSAVYEEGGIALSCSGQAGLTGVISQGCTPIGETWTITKAEGNVIHEIGNRPAYEVLLETVNNLPHHEQQKAQGNLFAGLVVDEYQESFGRGDFLIRNLIGADPQTGSLVIGAYPRIGQTIQFQRRDAEAADEDMRTLLRQANAKEPAPTLYGGCLCCCNGRGEGLFGAPNHDAAAVQTVLGDLGVAGFFCNGEIGPVGPQNFLHGYTASLALFVKKEDGPETPIGSGSPS